jgi:Ankyrin repeats (3 copies)
MFQSRLHRRNHSGGGATSKTTPTPVVNGFSSRIPTSLQHVFLSSNRGHDVDKPPPLQVANRAFRTLWSKTFKGGKSTNGAAAAEPKKVELSAKAQEAALVAAKAGCVMTAINVTAVETVEVREVEATCLDSILAQKSFSHTRSLYTLYTLYTQYIYIQEETPEISPQDFLDALVANRGYPTTRYATLQTAFYCQPTALQQASYSRYLIDLVKANDTQTLQACLTSGLSVNPCNTFGESLLHMVCRRGDAALLSLMLEAGTDLHVADDYGRTPLHDACWAPSLFPDVLSLLLRQNPANVSMFFLQDARGSLPLSYVRKEHWADWILFLDRDKDLYWPITMEHDVASLTLPYLHQGPKTRVVPHPRNALTLELASMVANGRLAPHEAALLKADVTTASTAEDDGTVEESYSSDGSEDSDYSDSDASYSDDDDSDDDDDEVLLEGLQGMLQTQPTRQ